MEIGRRHFMQRAGALTLGFTGLAKAMDRRVFVGGDPSGLVPDPSGILDLPEGFSYRIFSRCGEEMDDGLVVPGLHDGMAAFPGAEGLTIIVRNHEIEPNHDTYSVFGRRFERRSLVDPSLIYDAGVSMPSRGGTTTVVYDTANDRVVRQFASLIGTERNCAGGMTPHGTWISCEEAIFQPGDGYHAKDHGWCFEVPATEHIHCVRPEPIRAMGRFYHEATCTDPDTGIVYMTEDRQDGAFYRYVPHERERLLEGGTLQALRVVESPRLDTRNWTEATVARRVRMVADWVTLEDPESPDDSLRHQAFDRGCARFSRGEGMWWGRGTAYMACTDGGPAGAGQIWKYVPGTEADAPGELELFVESDDRSVLENADNITVAPWGDLFVCEDGAQEQFLHRVKPDGTLVKFGRNAMNHSEFTGATFSPDGTTLFVNIQNPGMTLAIKGPWKTFAG